MAPAAVCAGAMGNAGAAMRAAACVSLNFLARVVLCGGAFAMAPVCAEGVFSGGGGLARLPAYIVSPVKVPVLEVQRGPAGPRTGVCGHG